MTKKILIVEDHDSLRRLMGLMLSKDYRVFPARNGYEAMSWLSQGEIPDIIITDSHMPELDGSDLLRQVRLSGLYSDIPVVVVGGADRGDEEQRFKALGASAFLAKPFSPARLKDCLQQIVAHA